METQTEEGTSVSGIKFDEGKPPLSMISYELLEEVAQVRAFGAKKYARDNWKKGFKVTRSCDAALRHIYQFLSGQTNDTESGRSHLAHAVCALEHAIYDMKHRPENDDRLPEPTQMSFEFYAPAKDSIKGVHVDVTKVAEARAR